MGLPTSVLAFKGREIPESGSALSDLCLLGPHSSPCSPTSTGQKLQCERALRQSASPLQAPIFKLGAHPPPLLFESSIRQRWLLLLGASTLKPHRFYLFSSALPTAVAVPAFGVPTEYALLEDRSLALYQPSPHPLIMVPCTHRAE